LIPEIDFYVGRERKLNELSLKISESQLFVIYGISSIGKTSFTANFAKRLISEKKRVFWLSINKLTEIDHIRSLLSSFMSFHGREYSANSISSADSSQLSNKLVEALSKMEAYIFFDGVNNCSENVRLFIEDLCKGIISASNSSLGKVFITSTETPTLYSSIEIETRRVYELNLLGLSDEECAILLEKHEIFLKPTQIKLLVKSVGGHPLSILFYCQISQGVANHEQQFSLFQEKSVIAAQELLIERAINALSYEEREALLQLCIIPYSFPLEFVDGYVDRVTSLKSVLKSLTRKNLLIYAGLDYVVHDSIQSTCMALLTAKEIATKHSLLSEFIKNKLDAKRTESEPHILYKEGFLWAYHKEQCSKDIQVEEQIKLLLSLNNQELEALWAIDRYGYPFDFSNEDLSDSKDSVTSLSSKLLIKPSNKTEPNFNQHYLYETIGFESDEFAHVFLVYLCISRGISNHMGYIDTQKFNYAFEKQCNVICPWEHCIELQPLPPITRKEHEDHLEFLQKQFSVGAYDDKPPEILAMLIDQLESGVPLDAPESPDIEMQAMKCPLFGHCCPGGVDQATACKELDN
jgi:hypothetical protein